MQHDRYHICEYVILMHCETKHPLTWLPEYDSLMTCERKNTLEMVSLWENRCFMIKPSVSQL